MTSVLLDLNDYVVTDTGEVIVKYPALIRRLRCGQTIGGLRTAETKNEDIDWYNRHHPSEKIEIVKLDHEPGEFPSSRYEWKIPEPERSLDLHEYLVTRLYERVPDPSSAYENRLIDEIEMMRERGMEDFLRLLIYMMRVFHERGVIHGIGRGSACASLVLYLIGIHMVDPIEYEIPISEFLR